MTLNPPRKVRAIIYITATVGSLVVAYLAKKEIAGIDEVTLWLELSAAVSAMAGLNTTK